ncbi:MAG: FecR family protein [Gammaproteobacteria bacterium]|nr:FecR family protein [Gammaproteobacteria bacterium]
MSGTRQSREETVPSEEVRAKAASWVAQLHDEQRGPDVDARVRAWLGESEDHRRAFDRMTRVWELSGKIQMRARGDISVTRSAPRLRVTPWTATVAATLVLAVTAAAYFWRDNTVVTGVGQRQVRLLRDGTRVVLNTDTRIEVNYDEHARRVRLVRGEAWFDVSKRPTWPFVVMVDGQEIRALGTSFIVRHDAQDLSVTLVEGRISVAPMAGSDGASPDEAAPQNPQILTPGQRLTLSRHHAPALDRPELNHVTAWEHGRVEFDETPLGDAAREMNRYNTTHVIVADVDVAKLRIGGVFRAGDSDEFVGTVTAALGLRADRRGSNITLSRSSTTPVSP